MKRFICSFIIILFLVLAYNGFAERVVSILYFENTTNNKEFDWLRKGIADMLITDMASSSGVQVIEREEIEKILREQEDALSDIYSQDNAVRIGNLLNATQTIYGSFIIYEGELRIDAKIVGLETGEVFSAVHASGNLNKLFVIQKTLIMNLFKAMQIDPAASVASSATNSYEAARAYYQGLILLDEGAYEEAASRFKESTRIDPFYLKPQKSLEDAYKFLRDFRKQRYQRELTQLYEQAAEIKRRLSADEWLTYAEFLTESYKKGLSQDEIKAQTDKNPSFLLCNTRAQCTWHLQNTLMEIARKSEEYFNDAETAAQMYRGIMRITEQARTIYQEDPFLPEILYLELFALRYFKTWQDLKQACEYLMMNFSDYRMMWAIEDCYETALEKLAEE